MILAIAIDTIDPSVSRIAVHPEEIPMVPDGQPMGIVLCMPVGLRILVAVVNERLWYLFIHARAPHRVSVHIGFVDMRAIVVGTEYDGQDMRPGPIHKLEKIIVDTGHLRGQCFEELDTIRLSVFMEDIIPIALRKIDS